MPFKPKLRAFPSVLVRDSKGMLLRDYFASDAMKGLVSDPDWRQDMDAADTAYAAYKIADAMLRVREEPTQEELLEEAQLEQERQEKERLAQEARVARLAQEQEERLARLAQEQEEALLRAQEIVEKIHPDPKPAPPPVRRNIC